MVQLNIQAGKLAGTQWVARRFPVRIGRGVSNDLRLEDAGVWEEHLKLEFVPAHGFSLTSLPNALTTVNGEPASTCVLRNGDSIELGSARIGFWLGDARQRGLRSREWFVWTLIVAISLGQVALVYWLLL